MDEVDVFPTEDPDGFPADAVIRQLRMREQVLLAVQWFGHNFEDPVHHMLYDSEEGGYANVWGEFEASEELETRFPYFTRTVIRRAAERINQDGTVWVPHDRRIRPIVELDEAEDEEADAKKSLIAALDRLSSALERFEPASAGIGHNHPPEPIEVSGPPIDVPSIREVITSTRNDVEGTGPSSTRTLQQRSSLLKDAALAIGKWVADRGGAVVDSVWNYPVVQATLLSYTAEHFHEPQSALVHAGHMIERWSHLLTTPF